MIILLVSVGIVLLILAIGHIRKGRLLKDRTVTPDEALDAWRRGELFIDVRTPEEYAEGHVPGSLLIPLGELKARMGEIPKDRRLFLFCRSGNRSANATSTLLQHNYSDAYNVSGGVLNWKGPLEK